MSRLDSEGIMRWDGRVHESFGGAIATLKKRGGSVLRVAPLGFINPGTSLDPESMQAKLDKYRRLTEIQLSETPDSARDWVTLGLYWLHEGCVATAQECFSRGVICGGDYHLPLKTMAEFHIRIGTIYMAQAEERMGSHKMRRPIAKLVDLLQTAVPELPVLGTVGKRPMVNDIDAMESLPPFIVDAESEAAAK